VNVAVFRTQLAGIHRRPGRLAMTGLSVLCATFMVFGTVLAHQIAERTLLDSASGLPEGADLLALAADGKPFSLAQLDALRAVPGVERASGQDLMTLRVGESDAATLGLMADPGAGPLSQVHVVAGVYPSRAREVAVDRHTAKRLALQVGSQVALTNINELGKPLDVTVTAVVDAAPTGMEQAYAPDSVVATFGVPQFPVALINATGSDPGLPGRVRSALALDPTTGAELLTRAEAQEKDARAKIRDFDEIFQLASMFVAIAVVAAALVATSTFRILFSQRLRQLALLRAIGAQRGQLVLALSAEGALIGLVTGAIGVLLALGAGQLAPVVARAAGQKILAPGLPVGTGIAVVVGAALITLGAVLAPAFTAGAVSPLQALRTAGTIGGERRIGAPRLLFGALFGGGALLAVGLVVANVPRAGQDRDAATALAIVVFSGLLAFLALIALGPLVVRPVLTVAGWPLRALGPPGRLAVSGVGGAPRRAAAVSVIVALGATLVTGTIVGTACLQGYVDRELAVRAPADFNIELDRAADAAAADRLHQIPELSHVTPYRTARIKDRAENEFTATDLDLTALPKLSALNTATGTLGQLAPGHAVLNRTLGDDLGARAGDTVVFQGQRGPVEVVVDAILARDGPLGGELFTTPAVLTALGAAAGPVGVLADAGRQGRAAARDALYRAFSIESGVTVDELADQRDEDNALVAGLFTTALGLLALTVLIAVIGVGTTTGLSVLERTQEMGLLRALGLSRPRLRLMIGLESGLYGVIGAVIGLVLGVPYAWLTVIALNLQAPLALPAGRLALLAVVLAGITTLAGLLPARRAARISPIAALGTPD
jgi:putative ABC transport system permease protein